jgi:hypothetical protein
LALDRFEAVGLDPDREARGRQILPAHLFGRARRVSTGRSKERDATTLLRPGVTASAPRQAIPRNSTSMRSSATRNRSPTRRPSAS